MLQKFAPKITVIRKDTTTKKLSYLGLFELLFQLLLRGSGVLSGGHHPAATALQTVLAAVAEWTTGGAAAHAVRQTVQWLRWGVLRRRQSMTCIAGLLRLWLLQWCEGIRVALVSLLLVVRSCEVFLGLAKIPIVRSRAKIVSIFEEKYVI